ncbi:MAG: hypothetical protein KDA86_14465 [Planctomycetaceae bacterium]|nr:hypothetical protein [Planctomycetaceae bacterium]
MSKRHCNWTFTVLAFALMSLRPPGIRADETSSDRSLWRVEFTVDAAEAENVQLIEGRILVEAQDGGILLEDRAGVLWNLTPDRLIRREQTDEDYSRMPAQELADQLRLQIGGTAQIVTTDHYLIATTGSRLHAEWCGALLERLLKAFMGYWRSPELNLNLPDSPLPVVIYPDHESYKCSHCRRGCYVCQSERLLLDEVESCFPV